MTLRDERNQSQSAATDRGGKRKAPRPTIVWTNRLVAARMVSRPGEHVFTFLRQSGGEPLLVRVPKSVVRAVLRELGYDAPAICQFIRRDGEGYIVALSMMSILKEGGFIQ